MAPGNSATQNLPFNDVTNLIKWCSFSACQKANGRSGLCPCHIIVHLRFVKVVPILDFVLISYARKQLED